MFNEDQQKKIRVFSTLTKLTNECFSRCIASRMDDSEITTDEKACLVNCTSGFMDLNANSFNQLSKDKQAVDEINRDIYDKKT